MGLPFLEKIPRIASENAYKDVLFVCVDFENGEQFKAHAASGRFNNGRIRAEAGISIFDSRALLSVLPKEAFKTYDFSFGRGPSDMRARDRKFLFGETIPLENFADLLISLEDLLDRSRNIVLIGHGLLSDSTTESPRLRPCDFNCGLHRYCGCSMRNS